MVGIDIIEISRIERLKGLYGDKFLTRVFTDGEIRYAGARKRGDESLAGRFAAKEAFMKAWGQRLPWKHVEICSGERGNPFILFRGHRYDGVSISHERSYAVSVVAIGDGEGQR
jgi:phosphopantetheine--protein transferase-like protein